MKKISLVAEIDTKPGTCCFIAGSYRIAWVGTLTDKNGEITTCIKWYLPRTREERGIVNRYRQSLLLNTVSPHIGEITNIDKSISIDDLPGYGVNEI